MIVDTSALVATANGEPESDPLKRAMLEGGVVPAPVLLEYHRVVTKRGSRRAPEAEALLRNLLSAELAVEPFTSEDADLAAAANFEYGSGNGRGGTLNMLDLMVYGMAKRLNRVVLCTGRDFVATDIRIHPASRRW